jgi:GTPase
MLVYLWRLESLVPSSNMPLSNSLGVGNVDAGKSTLLGKSISFHISHVGVLTKGGLDDGRGKARVDLFRYKNLLSS